MADIVLTSELIDSLQFVDKDDLKPGMTIRMPDFLLIGPQRTGTTWMSYHLRQHPEAFIPKEKELFFFNNLGQPDAEYFRSNSLLWYDSKFRPSRVVFVKKALKGLFKYRTLRGVKKVGEASATYATMPEEMIREVFILNPDVKVVACIRDLIDRAWSHARLHLQWKNKLNLDEVPFEQFQRFYSCKGMMEAADVVGYLKRWEKFVKPGNLLIKEFSYLKQHSQAFLADLVGFLGLWWSPRFFYRNEVALAIGSVSGRNIDPRHEEFLKEIYAPYLKELKAEYGISFDGAEQKKTTGTN